MKLAHKKYIYRILPACNMPGVARRTIGPGLSIAEFTKGYRVRNIIQITYTSFIEDNEVK